MSDEINLEGIAKEIRKLSAEMRRFNEGPLTQRAVVVLLQDITGLPKNTIRQVLEGLEGLEARYLNHDS